jgi:hypothetical protein
LPADCRLFSEAIVEKLLSNDVTDRPEGTDAPPDDDELLPEELLLPPQAAKVRMAVPPTARKAVRRR